ncbi:DUF6000 family protein [Flammeovirga sp. SJP92]|uniref:DUF6000 family protein n=1 Tax=Flammeovirga sp. SJP92 TaxID=1775430 RepID=UPI000786B1D7|nr:DUF6000 family protein [Flammeovirga sp. SJP92]KXX69795.1 hypothetical protein AVL50_12970 [Flammeovirga sp. SJP92]
MINIESVEFHNKFIHPFYGGLMGCNLTRKEVVSDPNEFIKSIIELRAVLSHSEIKQMLNHNNWRVSKVGAWIIGLCCIEALEEDLINYLSIRPVYCEHIMTNLSLFNSLSGTNAIIHFVDNQLKKILKLTKEGKEYKAIDVFETHSVLWGFNAVKYLDSINSTNHFEGFLYSEVWLEFKALWLEMSRSDRIVKGFYEKIVASENRNLEFLTLIELVKKICDGI